MKNNLYKMKEHISFARSETTLIMEPYQSNSQNVIHGGELMKIMDMAAGIVGRKHSKGLIVTARIDDVVFYKPVYIGNTVTCIGQLVYVGKTSMTIMVDVVVHDLNDFENPITAVSSLFTMVHIIDGKPSQVPDLDIRSEQERELNRLGKLKYNAIKEKNKR